MMRIIGEIIAIIILISLIESEKDWNPIESHLISAYAYQVCTQLSMLHNGYIIKIPFLFWLQKKNRFPRGLLYGVRSQNGIEDT